MARPHTRRRFVRDALLASVAPAFARLPPGLLVREPAPRDEPAPDGDAPRRPNVLFVFSDSHRAASLGCYGATEMATPTFDALAAAGLRLDACVSNTPQCAPYRASLMSGAYAHHTGLLAQKTDLNYGRDDGLWDPGDLPTLGTEFARGGYRCGYVGKWHLGDPYTAPGPERRGFDDYWRIAVDPHDYYEMSYATGADETITGTGRFRPVAETLMAIDFVEESHAADPDRPWLCVLSWGPPHSPFRPPRRFRVDGPRTALPNVPDELRGVIETDWLPLYHGLVEALDHQLARLLEALDARGLAEDTLVVYTSDHGQLLGSHGMMGKNLPFSESTRVPMLVRWPGRVAAGRTEARPFGTPDILPTLLGLAGLPQPDGTDGRDLSARVLGDDPDDGDGAGEAAYLTGHGLGEEFPVAQWKGLRTRRHLYARSPTRPWVLYDLAEDPHELVDLVGKDDALVRELDERTLETMRAVGDDWH